MADPRLNSIHLEDPRRDDFRRAREALLHARGMQTLAGEGVERSAWRASDPGTLVQDRSSPPVGIRFWLTDKEFVYPLRLGLNTIGRAPENDVVIADAYVSRRHCAILVHASSRIELHDIASKNGTFLNGSKLTGPTAIKTGDEIRMCERHLVFMAKSGNQEAAAPQPTLAD